MSTNRLFTLLVVVAFTAVIAFAVQAALASVDRTFHESTEQVLREYQLGERYGELPKSGVEQALREYRLGERYGDAPQSPAQFSAAQILREYILGERYGVTPQGNTREQDDREYWLGERYGVTP